MPAKSAWPGGCHRLGRTCLRRHAKARPYNAREILEIAVTRRRWWFRGGAPLGGAVDLAKIPVGRNCFANEGLVVLKPHSGSARQRWARENSKHPRTAPRQQGFCSSSPE